MCRALQCFDQISRSYKVIKFWIQCKWRHSRECVKHFTAGFLCIFLLDLRRKKPIKFYAFSSMFNKLMKLQSFEWLDCISTWVTPYMWTNISYFMMWNVHLKQKLVLLPQFLFDRSALCLQSRLLYWNFMWVYLVIKREKKIQKVTK